MDGTYNITSMGIHVVMVVKYSRWSMGNIRSKDGKYGNTYMGVDLFMDGKYCNTPMKICFHTWKVQ